MDVNFSDILTGTYLLGVPKVFLYLAIEIV